MRATGSRACMPTIARCSTRAALDAVVVCSPAGTHAEVVLAALEAGLHVFVEKPMCVTLADADAIIAARDRAGKVVQVGTMKRYDPAVEAMLAALPGSAVDLRYVSVVVNDPEFEPYFVPGEIVRGSDVPARVDRCDPPQEAEQVAAAVGSDPEAWCARSRESFLGSLLHDLNVGARAARGGSASRCRRRWWRRLVERGPRRVRGAAPRERRARRQRLDPAPRHLRIPRDDPVLLRRRGAHAEFPHPG